MVNTVPNAHLRATVEAFKSPLRYPGGKQKAIKQISPMLPKSAFEYREPMVGGGSVFFHVRSIGFAKSYWINDEFEELVSFLKTVKNKTKCKMLMQDLEELRRDFDSADDVKKFYHLARKEEPTDKYRQALLFFFFNRVTFSGTTRAGGFSSQASIKRFTRSSIERLDKLPEAMQDTRITHGDFQNVIQAPGEDVFLFLDPPYFTAKKLYGRDGKLHEFDHERLADLLKNTPHRFLITYDNCQEIRDLYTWAHLKSKNEIDISQWSLQYGMNNCGLDKSSKLGEELFIKNY
ncbi:MAG: DNA adenine methylase [Candidatus Obscuribacterales bacterium]|nr:DNA adenine methylase [Candidatus Obscuribacterales bacterium]